MNIGNPIEDYLEKEKEFINFLKEIGFNYNDCNVRPLVYQNAPKIGFFFLVKGKVFYFYIGQFRIDIRLMPIYYEGEIISLKQITKELNEKMEKLKISRVYLVNNPELGKYNIIPKRGVLSFQISFNINYLKEYNDCEKILKLGEKVYDLVVSILSNYGKTIPYYDKKFMEKVLMIIGRK